MNTSWLSLILGGLLGAPIGAAAGSLIAYIILNLSGRRGRLACLIGLVPGLVAGFIGGVEVAHWKIARQVAWGATFAGLACALMLAGALGTGGLFAGRYVFGLFGVPDGMFGERTLRGFLFIAVPLGSLGAMSGYLAGRYLAATR